MRIRIGTRGSRLARIQTGGVADALRRAGHQVEEVVVHTRGDRDQSSSFPEFGGPGVFVREIERALLAGEIDLAVHSYKDLPSASPDGLQVAAVPERLDPADELLVRADAYRPGEPALPLPPAARVGTSSARRRALLQHYRHDLRVVPLRGNVDTRLRRLLEGRCDAVVLAVAGIERMLSAGALQLLQEGSLVRHRLDPMRFVPAPTQGALALQARTDDAATAAALAPLHRADLARPLAAERALLARIEGGCELPFGAWCRCQDEGGGLALRFAVETDSGVLVDEVRGDEPAALAERAAARLARSGVPVP